MLGLGVNVLILIYKNLIRKWDWTMKNILIHGLGQNDTSWNMVLDKLDKNGIKAETPNLYSMIKDKSFDYNFLFNEFMDYFNSFDGKLNLCGLSLGGILALHYTKKFPNKVNSLILIGTPYKIPKFLFKVQGIIFHLMPKSTFEKIGCLKKDFITLVNSMSNLDMASDLDKIECRTLILCGEKDNQNMEGARLLNENIKNSEFKIIKKASHEVNIDNPDETSNMINDFWR